jgi:hypothetical protein
MQLKILDFLTKSAKKEFTSTDIAKGIQAPEETVFKICEHLAANSARKIAKSSGSTPFNAKYSAI